MYSTISEFVTDWKQESEGTAKMLQLLTDASLSQKVYNEGRTLGRLAWHITITLSEMMNRTGLEVAGPPEDAPVPASAKEIAETYLSSSASLIKSITEKWTDANLNDEKDLYDMGEKWKNSMTLAILIKHEIHHRAQMTVLMRQAGLKVPGVYGPSKEEWVNYGAPPQE